LPPIPRNVADHRACFPAPVTPPSIATPYRSKPAPGQFPALTGSTKLYQETTLIHYCAWRYEKPDSANKRKDSFNPLGNLGSFAATRFWITSYDKPHVHSGELG
ncbi:MAG: hypothetical protein KKA28_01800, partial [Planctomycetes bacterium]|nr:hypothetical protein [Planctomycetota bacterium]MCG2683562.1 hypothetical protein [Planctomycetales bacterium]